MRHAANIAVLAFAVFCGTAIAAEAPAERVPHFADYPVKAASVRVARPIVPKNWDEDPRLRLLDSVPRGSRTNFAGPHYMAVDRKSTRLNSSHMSESRMPSSA